MSARFRQRLDRGLQMFRSSKSRSVGSSADGEEDLGHEAGEPDSPVEHQSATADDRPHRQVAKEVSEEEITPINETSRRNHQKTGSSSSSSGGKKLRQQWNAINSMPAIKFKMFLFVIATMWVHCLTSCLVEAGFFTFYFPNIFKPKGFGELTDMIDSLDAQINETRDTFSDTQYFWGQMQRFDTEIVDYPEESACSEVFPMFRDLAIAYTYADFEHFIKPYEEYKAHLEARRAEWYPAGLESKAALPREWEQRLHERELELKIEWLGKLAESELFKNQRERMNEIWKNVRRSLDTSLACIYLRYAYRQIAEDINQVALVTNLESMREAMKVLQKAYARVEMYKESDKQVIQDIEEELKKIERFTIKETGL